MDLDGFDIERAVVRISRWLLLVALLGAAVGSALRGWRWGLAFLLGAGASYINFRWIHRLVNSLGDAAAKRKPPRARVAVLLGLRYLLLGAGAYAILRFSTLSLAAVLLGLFVSVAAVILEILFELIYART